jgi:RNA polymerase sigma factor (sigma-70 family)
VREEVQRDLVERARRGEREAFRALAEGLIARLYNVAQLMLNDRDIAEDAVQETLVVTWHDLPGLRDPDRFEAWVHQILVRTVYRVARRERRHLDPRRFVPAESRVIPDLSIAVADADEIDRGFRSLTPEHRAVLVVKHYLGLTDEEAGTVLGVPVGTVKSRLHRATVAMRAELDADARAAKPLVSESMR